MLVHAETVKHRTCPLVDRKRVAERYASKNGCQENRVRTDARVSSAGIVEAVEWQVAHKHILRESIIEDAEACTNHRLLMPGHVPSDAHARRNVIVVGLIQPALANEDVRARGRIEVGEVPMLFLHQTEIVITQSKIDGEPAIPAITILQVDSRGILEGIPVGIPRILESSVWNSGKKIGQGIEIDATFEIRVKELGYGRAAELIAGLDVVFPMLPGYVVNVMPVGVVAVASVARAGTELREAPDVDSGQA